MCHAGSTCLFTALKPAGQLAVTRTAVLRDKALKNSQIYCGGGGGGGGDLCF